LSKSVLKQKNPISHNIQFNFIILLNILKFRDICDRVNADGSKGSKQCLLSVKKRLNHRDPHVVLLALSLLDCLWSNCGQKFRREVSSKEFIGELNYKCTNVGRNGKKQKEPNSRTKSKNKRSISSPINV
jgi:hypothetical protein